MSTLTKEEVRVDSVLLNELYNCFGSKVIDIKELEVQVEQQRGVLQSRLNSTEQAQQELSIINVVFEILDTLQIGNPIQKAFLWQTMQQAIEPFFPEEFEFPTPDANELPQSMDALKHVLILINDVSRFATVYELKQAEFSPIDFMFALRKNSTTDSGSHLIPLRYYTAWFQSHTAEVQSFLTSNSQQVQVTAVFEMQQLSRNQRLVIELLVYDFVNNRNGCKEIKPDFIDQSVTNSDTIIVLAFDPSNRSRIVGFATVVNLSQMESSFITALHIDLVCSMVKGYGKLLIQTIIDYAEANDYNRITLNAPPNVINFYRKLGFRFTDREDQQSHCMEDAEIASAAQLVENIYFENRLAALTNLDMLYLLSQLIDNGLVADKSCKDVFECSKAGYSMTYCVNNSID